MKFNSYIDNQPIEIEINESTSWPQLFRNKGENGGHKIVIPIGRCLNIGNGDSLDVEVAMITSDVNKLLRDGYSTVHKDVLLSACSEIRRFIFDYAAGLSKSNS